MPVTKWRMTLVIFPPADNEKAPVSGSTISSLTTRDGHGVENRRLSRLPVFFLLFLFFFFRVLFFPCFFCSFL